jgi:hypothetical protein
MGATLQLTGTWGRRGVTYEIEVCGIIQPKYDGANKNTFKNYFSWETRWRPPWKIGLKTFEYQIENPKVNTAAVPVCLYSNAIPVIYELDLESEKSGTKCISFHPIQYFSLQKNDDEKLEIFFTYPTESKIQDPIPFKAKFHYSPIHSFAPISYAHRRY